VFAAVGGLAIGGLATGGGAIGGAANGGGSVGYIAQGGGAVGYYARGGGATGVHTIQMGPNPGNSAQAQRAFDSMSWFFGSWPPNSLSTLQPMFVLIGTTLIVGIILCLIAFAARHREPLEQSSWPNSLPR
jgi:hypothetical protein